MSKAKHTPGPWKVGERGRSANFSIHTIEEHPHFIGEVVHPIARSGIDEREANARLIAAAPELADALVAALELFQRMSLDELARIDWPAGSVTGQGLAALRKAGRLA